MNPSGRQQCLAVLGKKGQQAFGNHRLRRVKCVRQHPYVAGEITAGKGLIEDDNRCIRSGKLLDVVAVVDDLRRELGNRLAGGGVAFGVGRRQTPLADAKPGWGVKRRDIGQRVTQFGRRLSVERVVDGRSNLLDSGRCCRRIQRFEPLFGVGCDRPLLKQLKNRLIEISCLRSGQQAAGVVVSLSDRSAGDRRRPPLANPGSPHQRQHVTLLEGGFGIIKLGQGVGGFLANTRDRFKRHSPASLGGEN
jgi:hypothetical protein